MSLNVVKKDVESGNLSPVYLWYGEDRDSLIKALNILKNFYLKDDPSGSGIERFLGKDISLEEVIQAANTTSFFSQKLVIVDDFSYFKSKTTAGDEDGEKEGEVLGASEEGNSDCLLEYCLNPNPATCLLLISEKVNKGRKLYKEINKTGKILEYSYPKGLSEWLSWIQREAQLRDKSIKSETASFLVEWAGHHTGILSQELDKLALFVGEKQEIGKDDIAKICLPLVETTVFAMLDAVASGNVRDALKRLSEVLSQEHYLKVQTMIVRQIRFLLAGSLWRRRGGTVNHFMETTGIRSTFEGNKIFRQAAGFSPEKLAEAMEDCLQTELALKTGGGNPHLLLETMVIRFCQK